MKTCSRCGCSKPFSEFVPRRDRPGLYKSGCRPCLAAAGQLWRDIKGGAHTAQRKAWIQANAERVASARAKWLRENRGSVNACTARHKAAKLGATPNWADKGEIEMWYEVAAVLSRGGVEFQVDHHVPLRSKRVCGLHVQSNLTVLPRHLNLAKGNRFWPDMP